MKVFDVSGIRDWIEFDSDSILNIISISQQNQSMIVQTRKGFEMIKFSTLNDMVSFENNKQKRKETQ